MLSEVVAWLKEDEGFSAHPYNDGDCKSIGYGRNLTTTGISRDEGEMMLVNDVNRIVYELDYRLGHKWREYPEPVDQALVLMAYQLGVFGLLGFRNMLDALDKGDIPTAIAEARDSKWAKQTPKRCQRVVALLESTR